jgi:uncharacterized protein (DUF608 family)
MVALPLGGLGTGNFSIGASGVLRQWQLHNQGNHVGFLPQSFFALRLASVEPPRSYARVLQGPSAAARPGAPLVNDQLDAAGAYARPFSWPGVKATRFHAAYPFARIDYEDDWPVDVGLEAYTPFVCLDELGSALPLASFTFTITNRFSHPVHGWLLAALQNVVGWDGVTPVRDGRCAILGGNVNEVDNVGDGTCIVMHNPTLDVKDPGYGSMALWSRSQAMAFPQFDDADAALAFVGSLKLLTPIVMEDWSTGAVARALRALRPVVTAPTGPSPAGSTWAGALAVPFRLVPEAATSVEVAFAWHFPNRYADCDRFGDSDDETFVAPYVGNHYAARFEGAKGVAEYFSAHRRDLLAATRRWHDAVYESTLPPVIRELLGVQASLARSPTSFRTGDGRFYGYEGVLGESTLNWNANVGGSCPLNCTHVWNYEQAISRLFPALERSMRETDWEVLQAPDGYLPHRVVLPVEGPQLHGRPIGGPTRPALDGMLGTILKTYREARFGSGTEWLQRYFPNARRLMGYVSETWGTDGSGVLAGDQPVTYDISLHGPNMFVGSLWLAALRAMSEMSAHLCLEGEGREYERQFQRARSSYDDLLWNGEYYSQRSDGAPYDFGDGCLSDQLLGQWWAHQLGLGHILPAEHVRQALASLVSYNFRESFRGFEHGYRVFADADDSGLLNCTWPRGGRPDVPVRYADEVWTGVEYQVAGHCMYEGLVDDGMKILLAVQARYDGTRRNPYNQIECGDHYARAMAGFAVLDAFTGSSYDALSARLRLGQGAIRYPLFAGTGWCVVRGSEGAVTLDCVAGTVLVRSMAVAGRAIEALSLDGHPVGLRGVDDDLITHLAEEVVLVGGSQLVVSVGR